MLKYIPPATHTENTLTTMLCYMLIDDGIEYDTEYTPEKLCFDKDGKQCKVRLDIVIIKEGYIVSIVEMKREPQHLSDRQATNQQMKKYRQFGAPVCVCRGITELLKAYEFCRNTYGFSPREQLMKESNTIQ